MGKLAQQINLLTRKNLKIRFSHKCITFCELFIPLIIAAVIGIVTTYLTKSIDRDEWNRDLPPSLQSGLQRNNSLPETFACTNTYIILNYTEWDRDFDYRTATCALRYDFINRDELMAEVKGLDVQYIFGEKVRKQGNNELAEAVMANAINSGLLTERIATNWTKSDMTEKQLEICVVHQHEQCKDMFAAIIIDDVQDKVEHENKFVFKYKIRMTDKMHFIYDFNTEKLFVDLSYHRYIGNIITRISRIYMGGQTYGYERPSRRSPGFVNIQTFLDGGVMNYIKSKYGNRNNEKIKVSLVRMPYIRPTYDKGTEVSKFVSLLYSLIAALTIFNLMRVNSEKSSGFKELLRMHGVSTWTQWMAWLLSSFIVYFVWTFLLAALFCIPIAGGPNVMTIANVNFLVYWLLLLLFAMSITTYSYLVSVFFERVWTAASTGLVAWIMLTVVMLVVSASFHSLGKWLFGLMLIPTVTFDITARLFMHGGGSFRNMGTQIFDDVPVTTIYCLFMLLLDSCIFMALAMYLDNVLPAKYGVRKPPFYFVRNLKKFVEKTLKGTGGEYQKNRIDDDDNGNVEMRSIFSQDSQQPFEPDPEHVEAAVVIRNLKKAFNRNKKRAVDGLNAKMFTGEIYALLGFNGAGKTTTMGILTGLLSPTDGVSRIFDLDIRKDMEEIREYIGLCPQHNLLYNEMSVLEQVTFFAKLKNLHDPQRKAEELLSGMGMKEKMNNKPEELSGGQKRRVHLAIALIGDTKLAFLDEPTSGLDPESRRGVWDILLKLRGKMTVIITTHTMEEADVLGDRIGIMSEGKMICSGTSSFLKKYYGVGYNLKMSGKNSQCDPDKIHRFVRNYVNDATLNASEHSIVGPLDFISISLPTADLDMNNVADLMDALREQEEVLEVENIGLSLSTMDEVFLKVGEVVQAVNVTAPTFHDHSSSNVSGSRYVGSRLQWYQFRTLLFKRMQYYFHSPFTLIFLILFFSTILWISLIMVAKIVNRTRKPDPLRVVSELSSYRSPVILLYDSQNDSNFLTSGRERNITYASSYMSQLHHDPDQITVKNFSKNVSFQGILHSLKEASSQDFLNYQQNFIVGASFNDSAGDYRNITGFFSAYALHSAPLSLNLISQTLIANMFGVNATIEVANYPLQKAQNYQYVNPKYYYLNELIVYGQVILLVVITSLLTGTAVLLPTEERLNKGKQLQLMTGASPFIYWMAMFTWDFIFFSFVNVVITLIYVLADYASGYWIYTNHGAGIVLFLILECHSFAALWFCYLVSWAPCIKTAADGFLIVNKVAVIIGIVWNFVRYLLIELTHWNVQNKSAHFIEYIVYYLANIVGYITSIVPMYSLLQATTKLTMLSIPNSMCNWFSEEILKLSCDPAGVPQRTDDDLFLYSCCENCKENCFKPQSYFNTSVEQSYRNRFQSHALPFDMLVLVLSGAVCAGILYLLEQREGKAKRGSISSERAICHSTNGAAGDTAQTQDVDVGNEYTRVKDIVKNGISETANHALIAHDLHLEFGNLKAVNGLSFGVYSGECFGLLGVNGAGKTSTFRILTGDICPFTGNMFSGGLNYYNHRAEYLSSLGYCPQFDGIINSLTGLQMVTLYGALRGIPPERLKEEASIWLDKFGLLGSASKRCGKYSGGMKRRLSTAMAMIGNPKLLLLDEPTTGVDPAFRRQFWKVIRESREKGQSVLLTSHTMDECEALCTRLGIMVDGKFKCLGNIQHLKSKHGKGYILTVKLKRVSEEEERENEERINFLADKIVGEFSPCRLQTKQKAILQYQILNKSLWYSDIFRTMEQIRNMSESHQVVEDYSVTETSLEDVFISFADQKQHQ